MGIHPSTDGSPECKLVHVMGAVEPERPLISIDPGTEKRIESTPKETDVAQPHP